MDVDLMNHDVICSSCLRAPLQSKKKVFNFTNI